MEWLKKGQGRPWLTVRGEERRELAGSEAMNSEVVLGTFSQDVPGSYT